MWCLSANPAKPKWDTSMFVYTSTTSTGVSLNAPSTPLQRKHWVKLDKSSNRILEYSKYILSNSLERSSRFRLIRSFNTYALAHTSASQENQLVSLWSAVEALISEPQPQTVRIKHFSRYLVPAVCRGYVNRTVEAAYYDCFRWFGK
jgi:hypothetical protein